MPRVELITPDFDPNSGDGSDTADVCRRCVRFVRSGASLDEDVAHDLSVDAATVVGSDAIDHPEFAEEDYTCDLCGRDLTSADD